MINKDDRIWEGVLSNIIELNHVTKTYHTNDHQQIVLDDLTLGFKEGLKTCILGKSGGGKTTLLNLIGGIDNEFEGDLLFRGVPITDFDQYRRENVSFIFQDLNLIAHHSLIKNITIGLTNDVLDKEEKAMELLERVGLLEHADKKPHQLSGGERQRVAIARALARETDVLLCDEPTGSLDEDTKIEIMELILDVFKEKTVIIITHDEELAAQYSNVIYRLENRSLELIQSNEDSAATASSDPSNIAHEKRTFKKRFEINLLARKMSLLNASYLIIIISAIFIFGVGVIMGVEREIDQYMYEQYKVDKIDVYTNRFSIDGFQNYLNEYNEVNDEYIMGFMTAMPTTTTYVDNGEIRQNYFRSMQPAIREKFERDIVYGRYPASPKEIMYSKGAAIRMLYEYYILDMTTEGEINILYDWLLALSDEELFNELNALDISYHNAYEHNPDRFYDEELIIVGLIDDYKYSRYSQEILSIEHQGQVKELLYNYNIYMLEEELMEYVNTVYLGYKSYKFSYFSIFIEGNDLDAREQAFNAFLMHKFLVFGEDTITNERALYYEEVHGYKLTILGACALLFIFAIISIYNGIKTNVDRNRINIGIYKSLGYSSKNIRSMFVKEGLIIASYITVMMLAAWSIINAVMNRYVVSAVDPKDILHFDTITHLNIYSVLGVIAVIVFVILSSVGRELKRVNIINLIRN